MSTEANANSTPPNAEGKQADETQKPRVRPGRVTAQATAIVQPNPDLLKRK